MRRHLVPGGVTLNKENRGLLVLKHRTSQHPERSRHVQGLASESGEAASDSRSSDQSDVDMRHKVRIPRHTESMSSTITFHGAARTVTGSRHLLELNGKRILVDCGMFQGARELRELNWKDFPVDPHTIDAVILTHAHTDHIGYLPRLVKLGYRGPVFCTFGTRGLCRVSLPDGGRLQEEEARFHNKHKTSRHELALPLYTEADAFEAMKFLEPMHYHEWQKLPGGAQFRFVPAGHILGSAFAEIYFENGERILMGGDLGRLDSPIIKDPTPMDFAEYLVIESTYGDRLHPKVDVKEHLHRVMSDAWEYGTRILVPSFAIGRTQELLWYLNLLDKEGRLPNIPIYVDSPMANAATLLYSQTEEDHDENMKLDLSEGNSPFRRDLVTFVRDREMSKELNNAPGPFMVISGSGMLTGGRILHHFKSHAGDPNTLILFTGYQAQGTLGRQLLEGAEEVTIHGREVQVRAQVDRIESLSAHADYEEILTWLSNFKEAPKKTFLVHGEYDAQLALQKTIKERLGWETVIPDHAESFDLS